MKDVLSCMTVSYDASEGYQRFMSNIAVGNGLLEKSSSVLYIQFVKPGWDVDFSWRALLNEPLDNVKMVFLQVICSGVCCWKLGVLMSGAAPWLCRYWTIGKLSFSHAIDIGVAPLLAGRLTSSFAPFWKRNWTMLKWLVGTRLTSASILCCSVVWRHLSHRSEIKTWRCLNGRSSTRLTSESLLLRLLGGNPHRFSPTLVLSPNHLLYRHQRCSYY